MSKDKLTRTAETLEEFFENIAAIKGEPYSKVLASLMSFANLCKLNAVPPSILFQLLDGLEATGFKHPAKEMLQDITTALKLVENASKGP